MANPSTSTVMLDSNALRGELASALQVCPEQLQLDQSFLAQGGDSLQAIQFMARCRACGIPADMIDILQPKTLSQLLEELVARATLNTPPGPSVPLNNPRSADELALFASLKAGAPPSVGRVDHIGPCALMQNRILVSQAVHPAAYHCSFTVIARTRDSSPLSATQVAKHWRAVVDRHPSLRTTFVDSVKRQGLFDQVVWDQVRPSVTILHTASQVDKVQVVHNAAQIPHQMHLAQISPSDVMLRLDISHACVDGRSAGILLRDLCDAFSGTLSTEQSLCHSEFACAENELVGDADENFWKSYLHGAEETYIASNSVFNKPRSGPRTLQGKLRISPHMTRQFCHDYGVTVVNVCQVAWGMVLRAFALKEDIAYAYISSGRQTSLPGMSEAVGLFISSLVLRVNFSKDTKISDLLKATNKDVLQHMPHDRGLRKRSSKWGNSILSFQRAWHSESSENDPLHFDVIRRTSPTDYDHSMNVEIGQDTIAVDYDIWESSTDPADSDRILNAYLRAIEFVFSNPESDYGEADLLGLEDSKRLRQVNRNPPPPVVNCIHTLVDKVVNAQPDAMAVCAWDGTMSFRKLDRAANALANHLHTLGVGPEVMVGMCMDKSRWSAVSALAILKAGGVVLPLATQQPLARLRIVLDDTRASIVLVDVGQKLRLHSDDLPTLSLIEIGPELLEGLEPVSDGHIVCPEVDSNNAAWVVYTSGSTGIPKGVVLQHSALCSSIEAHGTAFGVTSKSRVLQFASHTFDVMIQETFTTLCKGGCVCIPSEQDRLNDLEQAISSMNVNFLSLTSTVAGLLSPLRLPAVESVILMGEPVKPAVLDLWMHHASVYESYAPSECSIYATCSPQPMKSLKEAPVLGVPLASCFWVVDPTNYNNLVPIGAPGELLIEGPLLARGYLNDPEKTSKAFISDPSFIETHGLGTGRRMYRTGDLVRQNHNGTYSTLGRRDMQINIRGQRVEIGEVEYHVSQRARGVEAVIVLLKHDFDNEKLAAAFSVNDGDRAAYGNSAVETSHAIEKPAAMLIALDLQQYLAQHVPDYMIPRTWVPLPRLPVNSSGKVDRRAVSEWIHTLSTEELTSFSDIEQTQAEDEKPGTTVEQQIRKVWSEVLSIPLTRISLRRSLLSYGGDSITAMQMVSACRQIGISLSVRQVLQSGGISELAVKSRTSSTNGPSDVPDEPFNLSPTQSMYFKEIGGSQSNGDHRYNQSVCIRLQEPISAVHMAHAIDALVTKHAMLRARFLQDETKGWQQRIEKQLIDSYGFRAHAVEDNEAVRGIVRHSQGSLDIRHGPVFAADLIEVGQPKRQILFLAAHHLVIDLMSWRIITQDLEQLLRDGTTHTSHSMTFPAWSNALTKEIHHEAYGGTNPSVSNDLSSWNYWGIECGTYTSSEQVFETAEISEQMTEKLMSADVHNAVRTVPEDILLAALLLSFERTFTDRDRPTVFTEGHGRSGFSDHDLSDTVGWFTTISPLCISNHSDVSTVSVLKQVKEHRRNRADHQVTDFAACYPPTALSQSTLTGYVPREMIFNYHGQFQQLQRPDGLFRLDQLQTELRNPQSSIASVGGSVKLQAALSVEVSVVAGSMQIAVGYSKDSPKGALIRQWTQDYGLTVAEVVCELLHTSPIATPSDFPLARLDGDGDLDLVKEHCLIPAGIASWREVEDILPCSAIQQGILLSQMRSPSTYWLKDICRVFETSKSQEVDTERLANAWRAVTRQHSIMRTIFAATPLHGDRFYQLVLASPTVDIEHVKCADTSLQSCLEKHSSRAFRPGQPLHRFLIVTTSSGHVYGQFQISHAVVDASSIQLLVDDLLLAYEDPKKAPIVGSDYSRYVSYLETCSADDDIRYWQSLLEGAEPCNIQSDQNLGSLSSDTVDAHPLVVCESIHDTSALYNFCQVHSVTVANIIQLAWALVLSSRVDTKDQVSFGYLSSGRDVPVDGVDTLIGPMINMMICHFDLGSMFELSCAEAAHNVQNQFLQGFDHQRVSLADIQHSLQRALFNTTVSYRRTQGVGHNKQEGSLRLQRMEADESTEYDFSLNILASDSGIDFTLQYWSSVASPGAAQSLLFQLKHIVGMICISPSTCLRDLDLLSPEDRTAIKIQSENVPVATKDVIHRMTREVSILQPDSMAVDAWDGSMTYSELVHAAQRLGNHLAQNYGVGPEVKVGICMDKSLWAVVGMLATLEAGAVILPLSTQQPRARLQLVLDDTQAPVILVDSKQMHRLSDTDCHLVQVDKDLLSGLPASTTTICADVGPDNAAWIVYTSGSTGIPKGVVLQHHALCTSLLAHGTAFNLESHHRVLQFASHTFDVTIQEVFTTFFFGGCVCIPSEFDRLNNLEHAILSLKVNFLSLTSTVAGLLEPGHLPEVERIILLGEPVNALVLEKWMDQTLVLGAYGPSECSIQVTTSKQPFMHRRQAPVLGVPLASNFWVVDPSSPDYERLCPIGAPGELLIEGPLLAREYLNDVAKTNKSFIVDPPFTNRYGIEGTGRRMYCTGDLVRQNHDGTYTILGRRDSQIKIRGQRVEIGEVEYHIRRHSSAIHAAVILLQGSRPDDTKLVAGFSLPDQGSYSSTTVEEARDVDKSAALLVASDVQHYLSQHIPEYMIPRLWIPLSKLPVNPNGKIDRLSLSEYIHRLGAEDLASYSDFNYSRAADEDLPATTTERQVREIWSKVLNVDNITYRRSFLSYGGDSITAMQVVSACRKVGLTLTVKDVLQSHAISQLAIIAQKSAISGQIASGQITRDILDGPFDISPAQRMYFEDIAVDGLQSEGEYRFNQSVVLEVQHPIQQKGRVARAIEALVAKHPMLRARFMLQANGEQRWQQRIEQNLVGSYDFQMCQVQDDEAAQAVIQSAQASVNIEHGPIFRAAFVELPDRQMIFLTAHHLVVDLMSWRTITQDLEQLLSSGTVSASGSLDFPSWCNLLLQQVQQQPPPIDCHPKALITPETIVPTPSWDYWGIERGQYKWGDQAFVTASLNSQTTALLLGSANHALRTSPADILLAAMYRSFRKAFSDRDGPSISIEGHGRGDNATGCDLSETVGWLTSITPLCLTHVDEHDASAVPLVRQVKDFRKLESDRHALVFASRYLLEDGIDRGPIEILFNYHGQFQQLEREGGIFRLDRLHQPGGHSDTSSTGQNVKMQAALNVEISIDDGEARISIGFSKHSTKETAIRRWCLAFGEAIVATVAELSNTVPMASESDFPLAHITNHDLNLMEQRCLAPFGIAWTNVEDILPCSPVQQGILLSQLKAPSSYVLKQTCRILPSSNGTVDTSRLANAWDEVVQHHSIMRTIFTRALFDQGRFYQIVLRSAAIEVQAVDCMADSDVSACVDRFIVGSIHPGRPQHQFLIIKTTSEGHVYGHFQISHALVDASSIQILVEAMLQAYEGAVMIPPSRYSTYVSFLEKSSEEEDLRYWQDLLVTAEPCNLQLNQAPFAEMPEPDTKPIATLMMENLSRLQSFCRTHSITVANVFQLAWGIVLGSRIDSSQISFGYLSSGRDVPIDGLETLVGPMINMMICHLDIDFSMTPSEAIRGIQGRFLEGFGHQRAPLATIQHALHASQQPLFNTTLSYRRIAADNPLAHSLQLKQVDASESTDYDFNLSINASDLSLELVLQFQPDVATNGAAYRILCQLKHVVESLCCDANENVCLRDIELLSPEDQQQISSTNAKAPSAVENCIHSLLEDVAVARPDSEAICSWDGTMTFRDLDDAATRLAHHMSSLGVGPEIMVGICMDKSRWAAVSMLATLKAGGVVLPLATQQPLARLQMILDDTKAPIILVDAAQEERLAVIAAELIKVDSAFMNIIPASPSYLVCPQVGANNAAWVVYTSGSTGKPKGVVLQHRALCSSIQSHGAAFGVGEHSRVLQFASHTFDVTIQEMFTTMCRGGCVCIPSEDQRVNRLEQSVLDMGVNFLSLTSTVAGLLNPSRLPSVRTVILMGEPVKPAVVDLWKEQATVLESYAPSECSIYATCSPRSMTSHKQVAVLGLPLASCFWVVDSTDFNRLCPVGAPGELLIEGPLLARGYLNDPVKNNDSFVTDPGFLARCGLDGGSGRRMYRTGDLVRQNEDGTYSTLGRRDMQVKIWGQRVETGEIEYWVGRSHHGIRTAAAMLAQLDTTRDQGVLAVAVDFTDGALPAIELDAEGFVQPSPSLLETFEEVRNSLMEVLPRYMVPELFVPMANLPLNTSGKLDRRAIEEAVTVLGKQGKLQSYLPRTGIKVEVSSATARQLRSLWAVVLGRPENTIGANDNFFHTGGDSLMAMRLVQSSRDFALSLTVADVFAHPRLADLAHVLERSPNTDVDQGDGSDPSPFSLWTNVAGEDSARLPSLLAGVAERCAVDPARVEDVYPCTPLQVGLMIATARQPTAYISRRLFNLDDSIDITAFQSAWQLVAKAEPILRTRIVLEPSSRFLQVVTKDPIAWHKSNLLEDYLDKDRAAGIADGEPLMRLGLVEQASGERYFVWTAHHCTYDGYSMPRLFHQVAAAYRDELLPSTVPFARFMAYAGNINIEQATRYWRDQISDRSADTLVCPASSSVTRSWTLVLAHYAGVDNVIFAAALSGRNAPVAGIMDILAPTVTTVPLKIQVDRSKSVQEFLKKVQKQATDMIPFEHIGLQHIQEISEDKLPKALDLHHVFIVQPSMDNDGSAALSGLVAQPLETEPFHSSALTVECIIDKGKPQQATVEAYFDHAVISVDMMERVLQSFAHIAHQLVLADTDTTGPTRLSDIKALAASDIDQIRVTNEKIPPRPEGCLHELVLLKAQETPFAEAVSAWDGTLAYAELDRWSARLANHLVGLGVEPGANIGLSMAKSRWAVVAMLAILRAGATIVPLGVQLPLARIGGIISDAEIQLVLGDEQQAIRVARMNVDVLTIEPSFLGKLASTSTKLCTFRPPQSSDGAFIIYTSGSTGVPKGVVLENGALSASVQAHGTAFGLNADSRVLQFSAYTFDVSIQEHFTTLSYGGCVCVPSEEERMSNLEGFIAARGVNFLSLTSTVAETLDPHRVPSIETLVLLGEPVAHAVLDVWSEHATVLNAYGPAECSIHSTCSVPLIHRKQASLIGRPLAGCCFWVVDPHDYHRLCPVGLPGELLIEGPILARGYLNDLAKTADSFVTDPHFVQQYQFGFGRRMYRTGDIVKQNADGTYNMLGRRDTQVKIRGQRVELAEIEYCILQSLPLVRRVAVTLIQQGASRREGTLTAAIEIDEKCETSVHSRAGSNDIQHAFEELRSKLSKLLPKYMVPSLFVPVKVLPLNHSGKLDRKAIHEVLTSMTGKDLEGPRVQQASQAQEMPKTAQDLQRLWSTILGKNVETIGLEDNFFALGADSMSAMQLVSEARSAGMELTVAQVFQNPVLRDLYPLVDANAQIVYPINDKDAGKAIDLVTQDAIRATLQDYRVGCILRATDFQALAMSEQTVGNAGLVMYMTIAFNGKVDKSLVQAAYQHAVNTTEMMRATFVQHDGSIYQAILEDFAGPFIECRSPDTEPLAAFCRSLIEGERRKTLALNVAPLKSWFLEGQHNDMFVVRLSHAQYDGFSLPLLLQQLKGPNRDIALGAQPLRQMSYYVHALQSLDRESAIRYWRALLNESVMPALPTMPRPGGQKMAGNAIMSVIPAFAHRRAGMTSATYVKAAWALALARQCDRADVVFGHLVSGRSAPVSAIEQVVGPCVNLIPVRIDTAAGWEKTLLQVQAQQGATLAHEHVGFETIFKECTTWPLDDRQRPRFSTILQYQNQPDSCQSTTMYDTECHISYEATPGDITDVWVVVEPHGDELHIVAGYFEEVIRPTTVQRLVDDLTEICRKVQLLGTTFFSPTGYLDREEYKEARKIGPPYITTQVALYSKSSSGCLYQTHFVFKMAKAE